MNIDDFIAGFSLRINSPKTYPWEIISAIAAITRELLPSSAEFDIRDGVAVHKTATIEQGVIVKAPAIIHAGCFIGAHSYLRGGVILYENVSIGTSCEVKSSVVFGKSGIAHFNFIGDSLIGHHTNFEAGAVTANHYNEREDKTIWALCDATIINTQSYKFGALVGDNSKIGANAVLSPGTILRAGSVVKRLELIEQIKQVGQIGIATGGAT